MKCISRRQATPLPRELSMRVHTPVRGLVEQTEIDRRPSTIRRQSYQVGRLALPQLARATTERRPLCQQQRDRGGNMVQPL